MTIALPQVMPQDIFRYQIGVIADIWRSQPLPVASSTGLRMPSNHACYPANHSDVHPGSEVVNNKPHMNIAVYV